MREPPWRQIAKAARHDRPHYEGDVVDGVGDGYDPTLITIMDFHGPPDADLRGCWCGV